MSFWQSRIAGKSHFLSQSSLHVGLVSFKHLSLNSFSFFSSFLSMHFSVSSLCSFKHFLAIFFKSFVCFDLHLALTSLMQTSLRTPQMLSALAPIIESSPAAFASSMHFLLSLSHLPSPSDLQSSCLPSASEVPSSLHGSSLSFFIFLWHSSW